jgi:hypothetical protein
MRLFLNAILRSVRRELPFGRDPGSRRDGDSHDQLNQRHRRGRNLGDGDLYGQHHGR